MSNNCRSKLNRLANSQNPYLLQHATNPVDWHPWSPEVFEKAGAEDKPVFLSIGYSTCHWCHVMERESFSDPEVATLMNETFVCVKVDREERPDVDHLYMTACQLLTGSGGWPLTIIMTPDRKPFFAGTYFPRGDHHGRPGMLQIIPRIRELWEGDREKVQSSAAEIADSINAFMAPDQAASPPRDLSERTYSSLRGQYDHRHGGFGSTPKFPVFSNLLFLLDYWSRTGEEQALAMVSQTLEAMRMGGIYDHLGFGFHRYSTDARWFAPHFEKMLYDQALAVITSTETFCATRELKFREIAVEVIDYVLRDLASQEGCFSSAEDADSEGEEGGFYTWTSAQLNEVLDEEELKTVREVYNVSDAGNFLLETGQPTGRNILHLNPGTTHPFSLSGSDHGEPGDRLRKIREKLMAARSLRIKPLRDDKIMVDWNGLMIAALARAGGAFGNDIYAGAAEKSFSYIRENMMDKDSGLLHLRYPGGQSVPAFLDDYAYLLWGLIELHQATYKTHYLLEALHVATEMVDLFEDVENGGFFLTRLEKEATSFRLKPSFDGPMPSGNAVAAMSLSRLSRLVVRTDLEEKALGTFKAFALEMAGNPAGFTHMINALDLAQNSTAEVIIAGDPLREDTRQLVRAIQGSFLPGVTSVVVDPDNPDPELGELIPYAMEMKTVDGKAAAYVCRNFSCQAPTTDPGQLLEMLTRQKSRGR